MTFGIVSQRLRREHHRHKPANDQRICSLPIVVVVVIIIIIIIRASSANGFVSCRIDQYRSAMTSNTENTEASLHIIGGVGTHTNERRECTKSRDKVDAR